jgi:hypothetical protein
VKEYIAFGASPRGPISLVQASRALALVRGRDYVLADDLHALAKDALRHRLVLTYQAVRLPYSRGIVVLLPALAGSMVASRFLWPFGAAISVPASFLVCAVIILVTVTHDDVLVFRQLASIVPIGVEEGAGHRSRDTGRSSSLS